MTYDEWEAGAPEAARADPTWNVEAYRLALFAAELAWEDAEGLARKPRSAVMIGQLVRAAGSVAANIAEGYGRRSPKERVRFYEFALGSSGECRAWYVTVGSAIGKPTLDERLANLLSITRLLLTMIRREREKSADWMERAHAGRAGVWQAAQVIARRTRWVCREPHRLFVARRSSLHRSLHHLSSPCQSQSARRPSSKKRDRAPKAPGLFSLIPLD